MANKIRVKAQAVAGSHDFGVASTGTEQVGIAVKVLEGDFAGQTFSWYGYFTDEATELTVKALRTAGWDGTDFVSLPGLGSTQFELVLVEEERNGEFKWNARFINQIGVPMAERMGDAKKLALAKRISRLSGKPSTKTPF